MLKKPVRYSVVDSFTDTPFKGNPAAVCLLEEERDEEWLKGVATEFNISETCYLTRIVDPESETHDANSRFRLRWFTPVTEVNLCGHATLAAAHFLFTSGLVRSNMVEFHTLSGILTAKKISEVGELRPLNGAAAEQFSIELDFPSIKVIDCDPTDIPSIPGTLNGASMINIKKTATGVHIVELSSGKAVADLQPQFDEIKKCPGRGVIITGIAPLGSGFDFFTRFFCPKYGINEDPVCGSAHCSLAPYWSKKLGKTDLIAYMASPRGGVLDLHLDEDTGRVLIRGKAVTIMEGNCPYPSTSYPSQNPYPTPPHPPPPPLHLYYYQQSGGYSGQMMGSVNYLPHYVNQSNGWHGNQSFVDPTQFPPPPYVAHQMTKRIRNDVNVHKDTIRIEVDEKNPEYHLVSFTFDALVDGSISIYFFGKEGNNCRFTPLYPEEHKPMRIPFQKGLNQMFHQPSGTGIDLGFFELDVLSKPSQREDIFPLVIFAEACVSSLPTEERLLPTSSHAQITQAILDKNNNDGHFHVKVVKQILWVDGVQYELREIFGINNSAEVGFDSSEPRKDCVICMSEPKTTAVLPCRHMCACSACAKELRIRTNKCPICRQPIRELIEIKMNNNDH